MTFCDNLLKSFSENLKKLTKMNDFLLFLRVNENHRILSCIFIEFLYKAKFRLILSKAIALQFNQFSQKSENF